MDLGLERFGGERERERERERAGGGGGIFLFEVMFVSAYCILLFGIQEFCG